MYKGNKNYEVKDSILKASEKLFAENGYDGTSISQIAKEADITKSLLYYYFESKDKILEELFSNYLASTMEEKNKIISSDLTEDEKIKKSMESGFSFLFNNKNIIRILLLEMLKDNERKRNLMNIIETISPENIFHLESFKEKKENLEQFESFAFFFGLAPIISYMLLGDMWIKNNNISEEDFRSQFISMASNAFSNYLTGFDHDILKSIHESLDKGLKKLL
ncbi:TetR family transcriptional regulator [Mobilisporobacter senegalensis]|uniref:TetR family transcriptional regulator n=1 Tax=Mobilisporobacter senegalensis TaxID=1329262 RepID=A0A3N1XKP1_9FIRM|nr:TetR/AcrR family transcriptional regulator [Mobilisporobacter senegalensis]ROR27274.1 TetR family transcriptional regulator [Mobilisporobacter senegalensis]